MTTIVIILIAVSIRVMVDVHSQKKMLILSQYVRIYTFEDHALIYNTINGEIIILPIDGIKGGVVSKQLEDSVKGYMYKHYFLDRELPWNKFEEQFESNDRLLISLETFLACNLSCPYCYQINNNHPRIKISLQNLDLLFEYIAHVHQKVNFKILLLKILGGEPSLDWEQANYLLQKIIPFCKSNNIKLDLRVDTNCTNISQFTSIIGYDSIHFTIPLCHKEQHNKYRHYRNGEGTYDDIIRNLKILEKMPNCQIVLRHNTDAYNITMFDAYLEDISQRGLHNPTIMPQYTTDPDCGDYRNQLTYQQYINWLSTDCIDNLIKYGFNITIYPRLLLNGKCQHWSNYSLKLFSDGKVGACAAHFFDPQNPYLTDIMKNGVESIQTYWNAAKATQLFRDTKCKKCSSFFGCSSHYKLPCIQELQINPCNPEENLYLNWQLFFKTVYKHIKIGNLDRFPGLNIKII